MHATCPDPTRLHALAEAALPSDEQEALARHLDDCEACRQRLDRLADDAGPWLAAAREPAEGGAGAEDRPA